MLSEQLKYLLLASVLYLPTTLLLPEMAILLVIPIYFIVEFSTVKEEWLAFKANPFHKKYVKSVWLLILFLLLASINKFTNGFELICKKDYYSFFYLVPFAVIVASLFHKKYFVRGILIWVSIEVFLGIIEYFVGSRSIFAELPFNEITDYSLFYNSRIFGLSSNSSVLAVKVFIGFILLFREVKFNSFLWISFFVTFVLGVLLSFNRAVFLAIALLLILKILSEILNLIRKKKFTQLRKIIAISSVICLLCVLVAPGYWKGQLTRGDKSVTISNNSSVAFDEAPVMTCSNQNGPTLKPALSEDFKEEEWLVTLTKKIELSGRQQLWVNYLDYFNNNMLFGNGSNKLYFRVYHQNENAWKNVHAHNSYFMLIASHGLILSLIFLLFIVLNLKMETLLLVIAIAAFSFVQYGVFWGFSMLDLVFFSLLFIPNASKNES